MRTIAFYLPQFHNIPENDLWWGENFTEWNNVKAALPLFEGHNQPRVPLNNNYYNLLDDKTKIWQAKIAKEYGIYGFCYYHYWFNGRLVLEKPMEQMLKNKDIDIHFCISWANEPWTKAWTNENKTLIHQTYGGKVEWKNHFNYLLPFFKDDRYIKNDNRPLLVIYKPENIPLLNEMLDYWSELAIRNGFAGFDFAYQNIYFDLQKNKDDSRFKYNIEFQPIYAYYDLNGKKLRTLKTIKRGICVFFEKKFGISLKNYLNKKSSPTFVDYDQAWNAIINKTPTNDKNIPGAFVDWDNTPRHGNRGIVYTGCTPEKFKKYLTIQIDRAKNIYKKDLLFLYAWNEWAEGGYLEPDTKNEYKMLESLKEALVSNGEFPKD